MCLVDGDAPLLALASAQVAEQLLEVHAHLLHAHRAEDLEHGRAVRGDLHLHLAVVQLAVPQHLAEPLAGAVLPLLLLVGLVAVGHFDEEAAARARLRALPRSLGRGGKQQVEQAFFGQFAGARMDLLLVFLVDEVHGDVGEVADHAVHVAAHVTHLGELRRLDLDEGRLGQAGQAAGDLRLAHAGRADHDDVTRHDLVPEVGRGVAAAPAVAQGDGHGTLGVVLSDDVFIQLRDDLAGGQFVNHAIQSRYGQVQKKETGGTATGVDYSSRSSSYPSSS